MRRILLFSDVDGTLLDARGRYAMAPEEVRRYAQCIDIVLASSRTVLELSRIQRDLGIDGPVVAENGAVVAFPVAELLSSVGVRECIDEREWSLLALGAPSADVRADVRDAALEARVPYVDQLDVEPTLDRRWSVLLRPVEGNTFASLHGLAETLRASGHTVASGGSWLAITGGADKGRGARMVVDCLRRSSRKYSRVAAVGDGDNDVPLLSIADRRFAIGRDDGTWHPALRALPRVECVDVPGIAGWRDVLHRLAAPQED